MFFSENKRIFFKPESIKEIRENLVFFGQKGITKKQLAEILEIKEQLVNDWESGVEPYPFHLIKLIELSHKCKHYPSFFKE